MGRERERLISSGEPCEPKAGLPRSVVVLLGVSPVAIKVDRAIGRACLPRVRFASPAAALERVGEATGVVVIVPPVAELDVVDFCDRARQRTPRLPVLVALEGRPSSTTLRSLYSAGVAGVFLWPDEHRALRLSLVRLIDRASPGGPPRAADVVIEERARGTLRAEGRGYDRLLVEVFQSVIVLRGQVDGLWRLREAARVLGELPGVQDVVAREVTVVAQPRADEAIERAVAALLDAASEVDPDGLELEVSQGRVRLGGALQSQRELQRLVDLMAHVRGVRAIEADEVTILEQGEGQAPSSSGRRLVEVVQRRFGPTIDPEVYDTTVVLGGTVERASDRAAVEAFVAAEPGVTRVVNKLRVVRGRGGR